MITRYVKAKIPTLSASERKVMNVLFRCVCNRIIPKRWEICPQCRKQYGNRDSWPDWLTMLVSENQREYYRLTVVESKLLPYEDELEDDLEDNPFHSEPLITRDYKELFFDNNISLPYAPYESADDNKRYRLANSIPERG